MINMLFFGRERYSIYSGWYPPFRKWSKKMLVVVHVSFSQFTAGHTTLTGLNNIYIYNYIIYKIYILFTNISHPVGFFSVPLMFQAFEPPILIAKRDSRRLEIELEPTCFIFLNMIINDNLWYGLIWSNGDYINRCWSPLDHINSWRSQITKNTQVFVRQSCVIIKLYKLVTPQS